MRRREGEDMENSKFGIRNPKDLARGAHIFQGSHTRHAFLRGPRSSHFGFLIPNFEFPT